MQPELMSPYEVGLRAAVNSAREIVRSISGEKHIKGDPEGNLGNMLAGAKDVLRVLESELRKAVKAERELDRFKRRPLHMVDPLKHDDPNAE